MILTASEQQACENCFTTSSVSSSSPVSAFSSSCSSCSPQQQQQQQRRRSRTRIDLSGQQQQQQRRKPSSLSARSTSTKTTTAASETTTTTTITAITTSSLADDTSTAPETSSFSNTQPPSPIRTSSLAAVESIREQQQSQQTAKPRKHVHWAPRIVVHTMIHVLDMPDDLIAAIWYSPTDYATIRQENAQTLNYMMMTGSGTPTTLGRITSSSSFSKSVHFCTRGLEQRTKQGSKIKHDLKVSTLRAVLGEQERLRTQKNKNTGKGDMAAHFDEEEAASLARVYRRVSAAESQTAAFVRGLKDEQEALEILLSTHSNNNGNGTRNHTIMAMMNASCGNGDSFASICLDDDDDSDDDDGDGGISSGDSFASTTTGKNSTMIVGETTKGRRDEHHVGNNSSSSNSRLRTTTQPLLCGAAA